MRACPHPFAGQVRPIESDRGAGGGGAAPDRQVLRFLREIRAELFDEAFQAELAAAYQPRGTAPVPPALLAMVSCCKRMIRWAMPKRS